jgi:hypothetical protein
MAIDELIQFTWQKKILELYLNTKLILRTSEVCRH